MGVGSGEGCGVVRLCFVGGVDIGVVSGAGVEERVCLRRDGAGLTFWSGGDR